MNELHPLATADTKTFTPPVPLSNNGNGHQKTVAEFMTDAGVDALKEDATPEEMSAAITKFSNLTVALDPVLRKVAQSHLSKKLKDAGINTGASEIVKQAFKVDAEKDNDKSQGVAFEDPEPWPDEVSGAELLEEIQGILKMYTILPEGANTAIALWILFAWAHDSFFISPYLVFNSPTKRCGKSTALKIISKLVPRSLMASNISTAALFRSVEHFQPTLILDELDTFLNSNPEINGIINAGHDRDGAFVLRVEGEDFEPRKFSVWCPKVFAGIGRRKDTLEDRSIIIPMKRKSPSKKVEKIRLDRLGNFKVFRQKVARWSEDNSEALETLDPLVPENLNDRAQDNWRPLMTVAEIAGGGWPEMAKGAALLLSGGTDQDDDSIQTQLLIDIKAIFEGQSIDRISSEDLVRCLVDMEDRPWPEYRAGKPISKTGVARILKPFGVKPKTTRLKSGERLKGYQLDWFEKVFEIYLPPTTIPNVTPVTTFENKDLAGLQTVTPRRNVTDGKPENSFKNNNVTPVTDEKGGIEGKNINQPAFNESGNLFEEQI